MSNLTPGCLACLMDSDGGFGDCIDASAAVCVAADEDATNALWLRVLSGENIERSDLMAALSSGCSLAVMTDGGPAAFSCAMPCGARGPPLPPLTTCDEFTAAMATGGCAETCGGASGAYSAEVFQAATDIACPGGVAVVSSSAPITVSEGQADLLVRRTQDFPLTICRRSGRRYRKCLLTPRSSFGRQTPTAMRTGISFPTSQTGSLPPWPVRARKRAIYYELFRLNSVDLAENFSGSAGVTSDQVTVTSVGARRRQLSSQRRRMPELDVSVDMPQHSRCHRPGTLVVLFA